MTAAEASPPVRFVSSTVNVPMSLGEKNVITYESGDVSNVRVEVPPVRFVSSTATSRRLPYPQKVRIHGSPTVPDPVTPTPVSAASNTAADAL